MVTQQIAVRSDAMQAYFDDNRDLIRRTYARDLNDTEWELFVAVCRARKLNPVSGHITAFKIGGQCSFSPTVAGARLIATRTGCYAGSDDIYYGEVLHDHGFDHPATATCTVYRLVQGQRCAFTATVRWSERARGDLSKPQPWRTQPYNMLGGKAEKAALARAFPEEFSGLDATEDEVEAPVRIEQARVEPVDQRRFFMVDRLDEEHQTALFTEAIARGVGGIYQVDLEQRPSTQTWRDVIRAINEGYDERKMGQPRIKVQPDGRIDVGQVFAALLEIPELPREEGAQ